MDSYLEDRLQTAMDSSLSNTNELVMKALEPMMPLITLFIVLSVIFTVVAIVAFIFSSIQKHRTHKAILRIDQNIQKLVDAQTPKAESETAYKHQATN